MVQGVCTFCGENKELTTHEIIAQSYGGKRSHGNIIPNICRECHDQLEKGMNEARGSAGAGRDVSALQSFPIGSINAELQTGSTYLNDKGQSYLDIGSPIFGMRCHQKKSGEKHIEAGLSGGDIVMFAGSPTKDWAIYSIAKGAGTEPHI